MTEMADPPTATRIRLRRVAAADLPAVRRLLAALGYDHADEAALAEHLTTVLARPDLAAFLAVDHAGAPLGLIALSQRPMFHLGRTLVTIDSLVVANEARGLGVGGRLLRRARAFARAHRAVRLEVHTSRSRENYRRGFYPKHGFREADAAIFRDVGLEDGRRRGSR